MSSRLIPDKFQVIGVKFLRVLPILLALWSGGEQASNLEKTQLMVMSLAPFTPMLRKLLHSAMNSGHMMMKGTVVLGT